MASASPFPMEPAYPTSMAPALEASSSMLARTDVTRRFLTGRLAAAWRSPTDQRMSTAELIHARSGTPIQALTVGEREKPDGVASWAISEALEFMRTETQSQQFHVLLDGVKIVFWLHPENGDSSSPAAMMLDSSMQAIAQEREMLHTSIREVLTLQKETIHDLVNGARDDRKTINQFLTEHMQTARMVAELHDRRGERELEMKRVMKSEERKDLAADRFIGLFDKATAMGMAAVGDKITKTQENGSVLEKIGDCLTDEEQRVFGVLIKRAGYRSQGIDPDTGRPMAGNAGNASAEPAPAPASPAASPPATEAPPPPAAV